MDAMAGDQRTKQLDDDDDDMDIRLDMPRSSVGTNHVWGA